MCQGASSHTGGFLKDADKKEREPSEVHRTLETHTQILAWSEVKGQPPRHVISHSHTHTQRAEDTVQNTDITLKIISAKENKTNFINKQ